MNGALTMDIAFQIFHHFIQSKYFPRIVSGIRCTLLIWTFEFPAILSKSYTAILSCLPFFQKAEWYLKGLHL